ncbi:MAG TPA: hypothetical protein PLV86_01860 [Candidatus Fermentibacter daniensis]|nr:MAG: hypothetical protein AO395_03425 [Candidatus Fermentibacter daniensis]MCC6871742.1 hypothetical protein [Candidatus Fermentibacter sp.]KZD17045.1 MAG: hypothetical protein AO396_00620 [Candidatus Fermentibacter daniensis]HOA04517.1 hypothetical protein [Candidatus Fermentibacter daniensis]HOD19682.1 hypothetical protein [Candidatus Fermentibacter daniensis]
MTIVLTILLGLAGWSAGAAAWAGGRRLPVPDAVDLIGIPILWSVLLFAPGYDPGHLAAAGVALLSGFLCGSASCALFRSKYPAARVEPAEAAGPARRAWAAWKRFAHRMGGFQGRVLLGFFYFTVFAPFGILLRLAGDPLRRRAGAASGWVPRPPSGRTGEECLRQY